jgi:tight adherence protein B
MTRRLRRRGLLAAGLSFAVALLALVAPMPASAAGGKSLQIVDVNSAALATPVVNSAAPSTSSGNGAKNVVVAFRYDGDANDVSKLSLQLNGKDATPTAGTPLGAASLTNGIVFVLDVSASTDASGSLSEGRKAIEALLPQLPKGASIELVIAGGDAVVAQRFTTDTTAITKALDVATPQKDGALWEGVALAAADVTAQSNMIGTIVLITDGNSGGTVSFSDARGGVVASGATVYAFGVEDGKLNGDEPQSLAQITGGTYQQTDKATDLTGTVKGLAPQLNGLYATTFAAPDITGVNDLNLTVGGTSTRASFNVGADAKGSVALAFQAPTSGSGIAGLQNKFGMTLGIVLALLAAAMGAYAIIGIAVKDRDGLASVLQPYSEGYVAADGEDGADIEDQGMAQTAMMQRAVEMTRQFAEQRGFLSKVEGALERANLPLRAAEAMLFYVAAAVVVTLLALVLTQSIVVALIVAGIGVLVPPAALSYLSGRRKRQFNSLLPDTLQLMSGTLRAGYSMMQGVEAVSQEVSEPMGRELRRVVTESRLGRPLEESLDAVAERMDSPDFAWAVMAIRIQREVGGNLSELLMTVADTMTHRERLRRDVKSLTAEGRISAYVLAALPFLLGLAMYVLNPDYMSSLFEETVGRIALAGGIILMVGGFAWMQAIVKIDV